MLNALEPAARPRRRGRRRACAGGPGHPAARCSRPIAPHICHALWRELGYAASGDCSTRRWPEVDDAALAQDEIELVLQVNGKLRGSIRVPADADQAAIEAAALADAKPRRSSCDGRPAKKVVVVPGRLVNIVVDEADESRREVQALMRGSHRLVLR
ncbi:MAG: class I tRNA ligase family protein [Chromatiales bacterium]|nr:class I tRNA ligase family protein [Chromatiales bacterium]